MVGSIEKTFDSNTKTLKVKWKLENYLQLKDNPLISEEFTSDLYANKWALEIYRTGNLNEGTGHILVVLYKRDAGCNTKVDLKFTVNNGVVVRSLYCNFYEGLGRGLTEFATYDQVKASLVGGKDFELVVEITYVAIFDLLTAVYDGKNTLNVNWTIEQRLGKPVQYSSDLITCSHYPGAMWQLGLVAGKVTLRLGSQDCKVKIVPRLKVNGREVMLPPQFENSRFQNNGNGFEWINAISLIELGSSTHLVIEVALVIQVIESVKNALVVFEEEFELFKSAEYSDFAIKVQSGDGAVVVIPVHKCILVPRWSYFKTMLNAGLNETKNNELVIQDFDLETVKNLVKFLYCRSTSVSDVKSALNLLKIADRYDLFDLFDVCQRFICRYLEADDVIDTMVVAVLLESVALASSCEEVFQKEAKPLKEYPGYMKLKPGDQFNILKRLFESMYVES